MIEVVLTSGLVLTGDEETIELTDEYLLVKIGAPPFGQTPLSIPRFHVAHVERTEAAA